jgi:hypothetical protein
MKFLLPIWFYIRDIRQGFQLKELSRCQQLQHLLHLSTIESSIPVSGTKDNTRSTMPTLQTEERLWFQNFVPAKEGSKYRRKSTRKNVPAETRVSVSVRSRLKKRR